MRFAWPQIVMIVIYALNVGVDLARHGEPKTGKHNALITILGSGLGLFILWKGGFFS